MSTGFKEYDRDQLVLFPPCLGDWIPANDFSHFLVDVIDQIDVNDFIESYTPGVGRKAYPPEVMLATLIFAYSIGARSSRKIESSCLSDVRFRYVSANLLPDHSTLSRFRKIHEDAIISLFKKVLGLAYVAGMKKLGTIAIDGTKIKANASIYANKKKSTLEKELAEILKEAKEADQNDDNMYGKNKRGDELPDDLVDPSSRKKRLKECIDRLSRQEEKAKSAQVKKIKDREEEEKMTGKKKRGRKPKLPDEVVDKDKKANITDPESRIMKTRTGYVQGYNCQAAVTEDQLIISAEVTQDENDIHQLAPVAKSAYENTDHYHESSSITAILGDAGYYNEEAIATLENKDTNLYIAIQKDHKQRKDIQEKSAAVGRKPDQITKKEEMERKLLTKEGKEQYTKRGWMVEGTFGQVKSNLGFDTFLRRGIKACSSEWSLICSTHNLLKIFRFAMAVG